jgi:hypothetical protein
VTAVDQYGESTGATIVSVYEYETTSLSDESQNDVEVSTQTSVKVGTTVDETTSTVVEYET